MRYAHPDKLKFESAEGCYSQAVITRKDLRVKWAVKAFTDVGEGSPVYAHGVYLSLGSPPSLTSSRSYQPKSVLYTAATSAADAGRRLQALSPTWFEDRAKYPKYVEGLPIQKLVGERTRVQTYRTQRRKHDVKCMYWAPKTYQVGPMLAAPRFMARRNLCLITRTNPNSDGHLHSGGHRGEHRRRNARGRNTVQTGFRRQEKAVSGGHSQLSVLSFSGARAGACLRLLSLIRCRFLLANVCLLQCSHAPPSLKGMETQLSHDATPTCTQSQTVQRRGGVGHHQRRGAAALFVVVLLRLAIPPRPTVVVVRERRLDLRRHRLLRVARVRYSVLPRLLSEEVPDGSNNVRSDGVVAASRRRRRGAETP